MSYGLKSSSSQDLNNDCFTLFPEGLSEITRPKLASGTNSKENKHMGYLANI